MTSMTSSVKCDQDILGEGVYTSDSLDSEPDAPFRIIDPTSIMEEELFEEDDYDEEEEEYDEEELLHFAETHPITTQQQQPQNQPPRQRKQQIQQLLRDDDDQFNLLTVQEYSAIEKQTKEKSSSSKKSSKDKLYMLNPDDFKNDRFKQQQIRRAKVTHNHHRRKNREIQRLQVENKRLKDLVAFYEHREKRIRQNCQCEGVSKLLLNRPNLTGSETIDEEITDPTISEKYSQPHIDTVPPEVIEIPESPPSPLQRSSASSNQLQDSKCSSLSNKDRHSGKSEITSPRQSSLGMLPGPNATATASSLFRKTVSHTNFYKSNSQSAPIARQSLPVGSLLSKLATTVPTTFVAPKPIVPSAPSSKDDSEGPSTTTKNLFVIHKGVNGTTRLVKVNASALNSIGVHDHINPTNKTTEIKRTYSRADRQNNETASSSTPIITTTNPRLRLQNTLKMMGSILRKQQNLRNGSKSNTAKRPSQSSTAADRLLRTEITKEILRYWSDEVIPLPSPRITASNNPVNSPPLSSDIVNNDDESSARRSKRSATTSRLSTAELLGGTTGPRLQNKFLKMSEHIPRSTADGGEDSLDYVDWDTIEVQFLRPRQIYAMRN